MNLLLDTIAYNTYLTLKLNRSKKRVDSKLNRAEFERLIESHENQSFVHSATMLELYVKHAEYTLEMHNKDAISNEFNKFLEDFNFLHRNKIKLINTNTWEFDWHLIINEGKLDPHTYINCKIRYEHEYISQFYRMVLLVSSEILFDKYGDEVDVEMFRIFIQTLNDFLTKNILEFLSNYYFTNEKKEKAIKSLDNLLGYVLTMFKECVANKETLVNNPREAKDFIVSTINKFINKKIGIKSGAFVANEIVAKGKKAATVKTLIKNKIYNFYKAVEKEGRRTLWVTERLYLMHLLDKLFIDKYKVTKNDFSDYIILSSSDTLKKKYPNEKTVFVTFDKRVIEFCKRNDVFYDEEVYKRLFN